MQTWPRSAALASKKQLSLLSKAIRRMSRCLFIENKSTHLRIDRALLMRQKDANLHLAKKCGAGFQKAAQKPEQSNLADVTIYLFIENNIQISGLTALLMRHKDANLRLTKKCFQKQSGGCYGICLSRAKVHILRLDRALLMRHTRMQTCTWPRSAALASKKQLCATRMQTCA